MANFTSTTYILKRKILTFTKKFSRKLSKPERKFTADITYKEIKSKDDVIRVARTYFSRWKIEEYFRCKKQMFQFENFRVRKLKAINALNFYITLCMTFLAMTSMESETNALKVSLIKAANPVKEKVFFCYYRLAKGIRSILSYAKEGVRLWFRTKRPAKVPLFTELPFLKFQESAD